MCSFPSIEWCQLVLFDGIVMKMKWGREFARMALAAPLQSQVLKGLLQLLGVKVYGWTLLSKRNVHYISAILLVRIQFRPKFRSIVQSTHGFVTFSAVHGFQLRLLFSFLAPYQRFFKYYCAITLWCQFWRNKTQIEIFLNFVECKCFDLLIWLCWLLIHVKVGDVISIEYVFCESHLQNEVSAPPFREADNSSDAPGSACWLLGAHLGTQCFEWESSTFLYFSKGAGRNKITRTIKSVLTIEEETLWAAEENEVTDKNAHVLGAEPRPCPSGLYVRHTRMRIAALEGRVVLTWDENRQRWREGPQALGSRVSDVAQRTVFPLSPPQ